MTLSPSQLEMLRAMADDARVRRDPVTNAWSWENGKHAWSESTFRLKLHGLIELIGRSSDYKDAYEFYAISDAGRRLLAARDLFPDLDIQRGIVYHGR